MLVKEKMGVIGAVTLKSARWYKNHLYCRSQCLLRKNKAVMERESALVREWKQIPLDKFDNEIYTDINMIKRNSEVETWTFMM